jgi:hypothetical protein
MLLAEGCAAASYPTIFSITCDELSTYPPSLASSIVKAVSNSFSQNSANGTAPILAVPWPVI